MPDCTKSLSITIAAAPTALFSKVGVGNGLAAAQGAAGHSAGAGTYDMLLFLVYSHNVTGFSLLSNVVANFVNPMTLAGHAQALVDGVYQCVDAYYITTPALSFQCDFSVNTDYVAFGFPINDATAVGATSSVSGNTTPAVITPAAAPLVITLFGLAGFMNTALIPGFSTHYEDSPTQQSGATTPSPTIAVPSGGPFSYGFFFPTKPWLLLSVAVS